MDILTQANIFFFIASIAVVAVAATLVAALLFFMQILRDVRHVSRRVREESDRILSDVEELRTFVKKEGERAVNLKDFMVQVVGALLPKRRSRRKKNESL